MYIQELAGVAGGTSTRESRAELADIDETDIGHVGDELEGLQQLRRCGGREEFSAFRQISELFQKYGVSTSSEGNRKKDKALIGCNLGRSCGRVVEAGPAGVGTPLTAEARPSVKPTFTI